MKTKTIKFTITDNSEINNIMGQRGTLYVSLDLKYTDGNFMPIEEYDVNWTIKWKSNFSEETITLDVAQEEFYSIQDSLCLVFNDADWWQFNEWTEYDLSEFNTKSLKDLISVEDKQAKLKQIINDVVNNFKATDKPLNGDDVNILVSKIKVVINQHEGNITEALNNFSQEELADMAEHFQISNITKSTDKQWTLVYLRDNDLTTSTDEMINYLLSMESKPQPRNIEVELIGGYGRVVTINKIKIDETIFDEQKTDWQPENRLERIDSLISMISECGTEREGDKFLMKEALDYLMSIEDEIIFVDISDNETFAQSDDPTMFHDICKAILELNGSTTAEANNILEGK